jgi:hypothetical protein
MLPLATTTPDLCLAPGPRRGQGARRGARSLSDAWATVWPVGTADLILGLVVAAVAAAAGTGSWRAAVILARIEEQRRRAELTPEFDITATTTGGFAELRITLRGPDTLDRLDEVVVRILNERWTDHGGRLTAGGPSAEDIAKHVWGPWEFNTGASAQVSDNRTTVPRSYFRETGKDWDRLGLIPTSAPYWTALTQQQWLRQRDGEPVRLLLSCRLGEYRWELPCDVRVTSVRTGTGT